MPQQGTLVVLGIGCVRDYLSNMDLFDRYDDSKGRVEYRCLRCHSSFRMQSSFRNLRKLLFAKEGVFASECCTLYVRLVVLDRDVPVGRTIRK